ncbi:MAG: HAD family hydrolase [bacterium]
MSYKALIFDLDDTLMQTFKTASQLHIDAAKTFYNIDITVQDLKRVWGLPFPKMIATLIQLPESFEEFYKKFKVLKLQYPIQTHYHVIPTLNHLKSSYSTGILTAASLDLVNILLQESGLNKQLFDFVFTAEDSKYHKPDPKVFINVENELRKFQIKNNEAIYIGDSIQDYFATQSTGINFVGVTTGLYDKAGLMQVGIPAENILKGVAELPQWLETKNSSW